MNARQHFFIFLKHIKRNSPTILSVLAAGGVIATAISSAYAVGKAKRRIAISSMKKERGLNRFEMVFAAIPSYIPTVLIGAGTIACILGSDSIHRNQRALLLGAYTTIDQYHKRYREKLIELHGEEIDEEVRTALVRENCDYHAIDIDIPDAKVLFYEEYSGQTLFKYEREIMDAEYHLNRNFVMRGEACLNELYYFLGLPPTDFGEVNGWCVADGYCWIDFEHKLIRSDDGGPDVYLISMVFAPHADYLDCW